MNGEITREQFQSYMNTGTSTAEYHVIGDGFSELTEALNPKQKDSHYVNQKSGTSQIVGYAPTFNFTASNFAGDAVAEYVAKIGRERLVGSDCETDIVNVNLFEADTTADTYVAYKQKIAIKVDQVNGGAGGESMPMTGALLYKGDPVKGKFNVKTKTFTV